MTKKFENMYRRSDSGERTAQLLKDLQALPLAEKIQITAARIMEFVNAAGGPDNVVVSYSGGKDSTVLLHIARTLYPTIKAVYSDTGLEYPEVRLMARNAGADIVRPKMSFPEVVTEYGYPLIGKEVAEAIYYARKVCNAPTPRENTATQANRADRDEDSYAPQSGDVDIAMVGGRTVEKSLSKT